MNKTKKNQHRLTVFFLTMVFISSIFPTVYAGVSEEEFDNLYSEQINIKETSGSLDGDADKEDKASIAKEPVLPSPAELFGINAHKVDISRSDLTYSWRLSMVKSDDVIETIQSLFEKAREEGEVTLIENRSGNSIIAKFPDKSDVKTRKEWADALAAIDRDVEQVLIEVDIVELVLTDINQQGGQIRALAESVVGNEDIFQTFNLSHTVNPMEVEEKSIEGFKYFVTNGNKLKALLFSGQTRNKVRVLSSPQLIASNHKKATFKLGRTIPIITGTTIANGVTSYAYENKDIGIHIELTPHFCAQDTINIDINQEVNDLLSYDPDKKVADFAHKTLTSNVTLRSGETVALGGYIQSSNRLNRKSVPTLSKIPFIGKFLNRDLDTTDKVEVVVFLTPKVLRTANQINFDVYSTENRMSRGENMVSVLDKSFDKTDMGKRNSKRFKNRMNEKKVSPHGKATKAKNKNILIQDKMRDIVAHETSEEETRKEAIERLRSKYSN